MSAEDWTAANTSRRSASFHSKRLGVIAVVAGAAFASACSTDAPSPFAGPDPSDPRVRVPAASYRSTVAPYQSLRPVEPAPWIEQNQQVTPPVKR